MKKRKLLVSTLALGLIFSGFNAVSSEAATTQKTVKNTVKNGQIGTFMDPDYDQYTISKLKNGKQSFYNTTYIDSTNLAYTTTVDVEKTSKGLTLKSLTVKGFVMKKAKDMPYITAIWIQYNGGKLKYFTPEGLNKILKDGTMISHKNLNISNFENINVEVNHDFLSSANKEGVKYRQGINFVK